MTTANVVFSGPAVENKPIYAEKNVAAGQTPAPGALVVDDGSGAWTVHATAGAGGQFYVLDMNILEQKAVTDAYAAGERAGAFYPRDGETYNVILADAQTIDVGDPLTSNADGSVKEATTTGATPDVVLFYAEEAITTSGATDRIRARVATAGFPATA